MTTQTRYRAELLLEGASFQEGKLLVVQGDRIAAVVDDDGGEAIDLGRVALVPGQVNAHSHAFQRAIRGRTEYVDPSRPGEDFWTWREQMYRAALTMGPEEVEAIAALAFLEMARAGITTVGEFHYLHHDLDGAPYADPHELAHRIVAAADEVGVRIVLLRVAYHRGGVGRAAGAEQRRFVEPDVETYLGRVASLAAAYADAPAVSVGVAPHSIRAVPGSWLSPIAAEAADRGWPLHIHACEQRREIDEAMAEYGEPPVEVFESMGLFEANTTLVHATHLTSAELDLLGRRGGRVCACPTTERNLGDGFLPARELVSRGVPICLGSDSHSVIDPFEEMRLVEYHERLRAEQRNVLVAAAGPGAPAQTARLLWPMGTTHGAESLGIEAGELAAGRLADVVGIDLDHISLATSTADTLLADLTLAATPAVVREVMVGGRRIVTDGAHRRGSAIIGRARDALRRTIDAGRARSNGRKC